MDEINSIWFYLEPDTFISEDSEAYFLYNSGLKKGLSFQKTELIESVMKKLQDVDQLYSVKLPLEDVKDESLFQFIEMIQETGLGDIVEGDLEKPVVLPPLLNLQGAVERLKEHGAPIGDHILSYLHEVTIYLNGNCPRNCQGCSSEFKQFISCTKSQYTLDFEALKRFLFSISGSKASINLLGGDLFQYKRLNEILFILEGMDNSYTLILDWRNLPDLNDIKKYESLQLKLLSHEPFESEEVMKAARRIAKSGIAYSWELYVSSEEEYEKAAILKEMLANFSDVSIRPFYNGENRSFFENFVYTDQEELDSIAWNRQNIFALQALNMNNFGKITILSDGKVYANVNEAPIGTIQDPIKDLLVKELESKNAWRKTRYDVEPCAHCRFKLICPSPSNYERVIGKNNLCHILK